MILTESQYKITHSIIAQLNKAIELMEEKLCDQELDDYSLEVLRVNGLKREHKKLSDQIGEYDKNRLKVKNPFIVNKKQELGVTLIRARLAKGLTQAAFSKRIGLSKIDLDKLESQEYKGANPHILKASISALNIQLAYKKNRAVTAQIDSKGIFVYSDFPFNEMFKRKWFANFTGTLKEAKTNAATLIADLLGAQAVMAPAFHRKNTRKGKESNPRAMIAWQARVKILARSAPPRRPFRMKVEKWASLIQGLRELIIRPNGISLVKNHLSDYGIGFVVERQLQSLYLDGMACIHEDGYPMIAVTTRYDRLDNFWFVLFHELGHIALHLNSPRNSKRIFLDDMEGGTDQVEREADDFAAENLIPKQAWESCNARRFPNKRNILIAAKNLETSPAIIAGWIRKERNNFRLFNDLVGHGQVRSALM